MNCLEFRRAVGAEPQLATPEVLEHEKSCAACAKYRQELLKMDRLIHRALAISPQAAAPAPATRRVVHPMRWATAAAVMIGVMIATALWVSAPQDSLAVELVEHAKGEPDSLVQTTDHANAAEVASILAQSRVALKSDALLVSYVQRCFFRGHYVPHLVVQTETGPVVVIVLADETPVKSPKNFDTEGFQGVILPAPRGALAALADGPRAAAAAQKILEALDYQR